MATILVKDVTRESELECNGRKIVVTLTKDQRVSMKLKGMKSGIVSIGLDELYAQLTGEPCIDGDPEEKNNLIDQEKDMALHMKKKILSFLNQQSNEGDADSSNLTEKSKKLLIKLGYLEKE